MWVLEYAQFYNGEFRAWIEAGRFDTKTDAQRVAKNNELNKPGDDHIISYVDREE